MRIEPVSLMPAGSRIEAAAAAATETPTVSFGQVFSEALNRVNTLQQTADKATIDMAAGKVEDISQVMIASEKAGLALQLTMQVRNKIVDAYQEVMRMQM